MTGTLRSDSLARAGRRWILAVVDTPPAPARPAFDAPTGLPPPAVGRALRALDTALLLAGLGAAAAAAAGAPTGAAALLGLAAWLAIEAGPAGRWLRAVRRLEWQRARALVATGRALARARRGDPGALERAGDAYEREGRARAGLAALGAEPARVVGWLRGAAQRTARSA
jgi:hypothetical protein